MCSGADSRDARTALFGLHGLVSGAVDKGSTPATCLFQGLGLQGAFGGFHLQVPGLEQASFRSSRFGVSGFVSGLGL